MAWKSSETLIRRNLKLLRGDHVAAIRSRRHEPAPGIVKDESLTKTKFSEFLLREKLAQSGLSPADLLRRAAPATNCPSLNYFVMQYLFNTKNQVQFDPLGALRHFVVPGVSESSSREAPLAATERSSQGQGGEEDSAENSSVPKSFGSSGLSSARLEILKMRASRRTHDDSKDTAQLE